MGGWDGLLEGGAREGRGAGWGEKGRGGVRDGERREGEGEGDRGSERCVVRGDGMGGLTGGRGEVGARRDFDDMEVDIGVL